MFTVQMFLGDGTTMINIMTFATEKEAIEFTDMSTVVNTPVRVTHDPTGIVVYQRGIPR